jgi:hypothetical protein
VLGSVVGTRLKLDVGMTVDPRLYTVLLGESYSVKKSTAVKKTIDYFERQVCPVTPPHVLYGVGSAEGLARELQSKPEAILVYDELRALVDKCGVKGSTLLPMVTSLFEGNSWQNSTKSLKSSASVKDAQLSMLACCTLDTYEHVWKQDAIAIGLPNRLFVVNADRRCRIAWPSKPDASQLARITARFKAQLARLPLDLTIDEEAKEEWERWYNALPNSEHCRRLDTIGFRMLGLIALTTDRTSIDVETVKTVVSILEYEFQLRVLTDPIDADSTIAALEEKIRRQLVKGPLTPRQLQQLVHAHRTGLWAFSSALNNLQNVSKEVELRSGQYLLAGPFPKAGMTALPLV